MRFRRIGLFFLFFLSLVQAQKLLLSNYPESFYKEGNLCNSGRLVDNSRLLVFHKNLTGKNGYLKISIEGYEGSYFKLRSTFSGPDLSELFVGKILTEKFYKNKFEFVKFPHTIYVPIKKGMISAAILDIALIKKDAYVCKVDFVFEKDKIFFNESDETKNLFPKDDLFVNMVLEQPYYRYNAKIGDDCQVIENEYKLLPGNYGLNYKFNWDFKVPGIYSFYLTANGGPAWFVGLLNGKILSAYVEEHVHVKDFEITEPSQYCLETMPLPGSNYPVTITIILKKLYTNKQDDN